MLRSLVNYTVWNLKLLFMCCVCGGEHKHRDGRVEIRGRLAGVRLLILLFGSWGWKSSPQGWEQEPLLTEPITAPVVHGFSGICLSGQNTKYFELFVLLLYYINQLKFLASLLFF